MTGGGDVFLADVLAGLRARPRRLPSKYFYDARGSALFETICALPEYYLTRAELELMQRWVPDIALSIGPGACVIEYGSGSGLKTRLLLERLEAAAYLPVEISPTALEASVRRLREAFPALEVHPVCADFTAPFSLPAVEATARRRLVYFPGSTIGNFDEQRATGLLRHMRTLAGSDGAALVGADLVKDAAVLEAAYNDAAGVTADFTLNLLARINRELGADFDLDGFRHRARWVEARQRIETDIVCHLGQTVHVGGEAFDLAPGDAIAVELSCKYTPESFGRLATAAGWAIADAWSDTAGRFSLFLLR